MSTKVLEIATAIMIAIAVLMFRKGRDIALGSPDAKRVYNTMASIISIFVILANLVVGLSYNPNDAPTPTATAINTLAPATITPTRTENPLTATDTNTPPATNTQKVVSYTPTQTNTFTPSPTLTFTPSETPTTPPTITSTPGYSSPTPIVKASLYPSCGKSAIDEWMLAQFAEKGYTPYVQNESVDERNSAAIAMTLIYSIKSGTANTCVVNVIITDGILYSMKSVAYTGNYHDIEIQVFVKGNPVNGVYAVDAKMHEDACNFGWLFEIRYLNAYAKLGQKQLPSSCFGITK